MQEGIDRDSWYGTVQQDLKITHDELVHFRARLHQKHVLPVPIGTPHSEDTAKDFSLPCNLYFDDERLLHSAPYTGANCLCYRLNALLTHSFAQPQGEYTNLWHLSHYGQPFCSASLSPSRCRTSSMPGNIKHTDVCSIWGAYTVWSDPHDFVAKQVPSKIPEPPLSSSNEVIVLMLGNVYVLLAGLAILCCFFAPRHTALGYLGIVAVADIGHIYSAYLGLGWDKFVDFGSYNDMAWGNIGCSAFLHVNRLATVLGFFGRTGNMSGKKKTN